MKIIKTYTALNIQWPISEMILNKEKTIETRTYPIPDKYLGKDLLMIETPGKNGNFKARVVAIINFSECKKYTSKESFYKETNLHCVTKNSEWAWTNKSKFGWKIEKVLILDKPFLAPPKKGIIFTNNISIT